jgi:hypothetical protein
MQQGKKGGGSGRGAKEGTGCYLRGDVILNVTQRVGVDAIPPGVC